MISYSILISEDEITIADTWKKHLTKKNFDVTVANDGEQALQYWQQNPYDVILLDLLTPKIRGGELLKRIKEKQPWTQVIIISGEGKEEDKLEAINRHAYAYLPKPVKTNLILETINNALSSRDTALLSLEAMAKRSEKGNEPFLTIGQDVFSPQSLYDEVRKGTEIGVDFLASWKKTLIAEGVLPSEVETFQAAGVIE